MQAETSVEFRIYQHGFDDGTAAAWRVVAELAGSVASDADLREAVTAMATKVSDKAAEIRNNPQYAEDRVTRLDRARQAMRRARVR